MTSKTLLFQLMFMVLVALTGCGVAVTGISLDATTASIKVGGTRTLSAIIEPDTASDQDVTWSTSDASIATISTTTGGTTVVTGVAAGTVTIVATAASDPTKTARCTVTVARSAVAVTGVTLSATSVSLVAGTTRQLTATVIPTTATNQTVTWTSDAHAVATVSSTGLVSTFAAGTATVTVTTADGTKAASCVVTVTPAPVAVTGVTLDSASLELAVQPGTAKPLTATIAPAEATNQDLTWTTSDSTIADVSATSGTTVNVIPVHSGIATITVTTADGHFSQSSTVTVALLDVAIAANTASTNFNETTAGSGQYDTKSGGAYMEMMVGPLKYYSDANGFKNGDVDQGLYFNFYASGTGAVVSATQAMKSYIGIPAASVQTTATSLKVTVTAKSAANSSGSRLALLAHNAIANGRVIALSNTLSTTKADYVFDGVPPNTQIDLCNGGPNNNSMYVEAIKVETSTTPVPDTIPCANVTALKGLTDLVLSNQVALSWTNPTDMDLAGVQISYDGLATPITVAKPLTSYTATGLTAGTPYTFTVKSVDTAGNLSNGITVSATPGVLPPLFDEAVTASLAGPAVSGCIAGQEVSITGSRLTYYMANCGLIFKANDGKFMFNTAGVSPTAVGSTPTTVTAYVGVPAAFTAATSRSIKVTVMATQYTATVGLKMLIMDGANKVVGSTTLAAGTSSGAVPVAYVFDGLAPGGELKITSDASFLYITNVKVEESATLLEEPVASSLAALAVTACSAGSEVSVSGSRLSFYMSTCGQYFKANDGKFMFNSAGVSPAPVGSTPTTVTSYVGIPTAFTTTTKPSVKVTVMATQYATTTGLNLLLLDGSNKVLAATQLAAGATSGAVAIAYVFDGLPPGGAIKITSDATNMYITNVRVEGSSTPPSALLNESVPASLAALAVTACSAAPGTEQTIVGSNLLYFTASAQQNFKANDGKFMFNGTGVSPTAIGSTPSTVNFYVAVPARYTGTSSPSLKVTVTATQYNTTVGLKLILLNASNKVIASTTLAAGTTSGAVAVDYTFDGVIRGGEFKISADNQYMYVTNIKVEASPTAVVFQ